MKLHLLEYFREAYVRNRVLAVTGWGMLGLFAVMLLIAPFDSRSIMGINPWIKPMKFAVSICIFVWTVAWFSRYVARFRRTLNLISWGIAIAMVTEIFIIGLQAGRGTTSHFNNATKLDGMLFSIMGNMIALNTVLVFLLLVLFCTRLEIAAPYLWGIRLGTIIMLLASAEGGLIVANKAHAVGVSDGGPGLPVVNWSTEAGDLRVAHFLGLHALQIVPLAGYLIGKRTRWPERARVGAIFAFALAYAAAFGFVFWQAMQGRPVYAGLL